MTKRIMFPAERIFAGRALNETALAEVQSRDFLEVSFWVYLQHNVFVTPTLTTTSFKKIDVSLFSSFLNRHSVLSTHLLVCICSPQTRCQTRWQIQTCWWHRSLKSWPLHPLSLPRFLEKKKKRPGPAPELTRHVFEKL